ncbi:hypothetical protein FGB62_237g02 [Gracilaria domingensis]|nr:hypothetical protein FGB62_237g02 [Gracilaria domingensis]
MSSSMTSKVFKNAFLPPRHVLTKTTFGRFTNSDSETTYVHAKRYTPRNFVWLARDLIWEVAPHENDYDPIAILYDAVDDQIDRGANAMFDAAMEDATQAWWPGNVIERRVYLSIAVAVPREAVALNC